MNSQIRSKQRETSYLVKASWTKLSATAMFAITLFGCASAPQTVDTEAAKWSERAKARATLRWESILAKKFEVALATYSEASQLNFSVSALEVYEMQLQAKGAKVLAVDCKGNGCDVEVELVVALQVPHLSNVSHPIRVTERWLLEKGDLFFVRKI